MAPLTRDQLHGFVPAVVTPFSPTGAIQEDAFAAMIDHMVAIGASGICVAGDNGESWALDSAERARLTRIAVDRLGGRLPVITGATAPSAAKTIIHAQAALEGGASAVLVMPQTYVLGATRDELLRRFEHLARAVEVPIVAYNSPRRAGIDLSVDDIEALLGIAPIVGIKESSRDFGRLLRLIERLGTRVSVMVGPAYFVLPGLAVGAAGCIATGPEFLGPGAGTLVELARSAPGPNYAKTQFALAHIYEALMSTGTWPASLKAGLALLGLAAGLPRDPLLPLSPEATSRLRMVLEELDLIRPPATASDRMCGAELIAGREAIPAVDEGVL